MYICIESLSTDPATTVTASSRQSTTSHSSHRLSGGSRVGIVGVANPPPLLLASQLKHKVLKPHCAHFQYLIKINEADLDEVRHLAAKLQTRNQDIFVA